MLPTATDPEWECRNSSLLTNIGECFISIVSEQHIRLGNKHLGSTKFLEGTAVRHKNIQVTIVVIVKEGSTPIRSV